MAQHRDTPESVFADEHVGFIDGHFPRSSFQEQITSGSSCVTWDEKAEIMEPKSHESGLDETLDVHQNISELDANRCGAGNITIVDQMEIFGERSIQESTVDQIEMLGNKNIRETTVDQMEMLGDNNIHESVSSTNEIDEIESETDNYMDALNTIESESENDLDCQTKREVEQFSSIFNNEGAQETHELTVHCSDHHDDPPPFESHSASFISTNKEVPADLHDSVSLEICGHEQTPTTNISSNKEEPCDLPNSISLESHANVQLSEKAGESSTVHSVGITRSADVLDGSELESVIADPSTSVNLTYDAQDPLENKTTSNFFESEESQADLPGNHSMRFWTNGGLLGLEPSKPPDFAMASTITRDSENGSKTDTVGPLNHTFMPKDGVHGGKLHMLAQNTADNEKDSSSKCSTSCCNDEEDGISTMKTSQGSSTIHLGSTHGTADDFHMHNGFHNASKNNSEETSVAGTGKVLPVALNVKYASAEPNEEHDENSSLVFGFSRRLLSNGLTRKVSDVNGGKFEPASSMKDSVLEQDRDAHQRVPEIAFREQFGFGSAVDSPSSPRLEHMKISFHPLDGFETSKLKLQFSDGTQSHESIRDMFPSFQLIPEPSIPRNNYGSDSDDDTFCRSSPCMSDDCRGHHSDSNSEQWECGENLEGKDNGVYDALQEISSLEHIPGCLDLDGITNSEICFDGGVKPTNTTNRLELSLCDPILELPSFDAVKPAIQTEAKDDSDPKNLDSRGHIDPSPTPPPLPPAQWRVSISHLDVAEGIMDVASEDFKHALGAKLFGSTTSQQPKQAPADQQNKEEPTVKPESKV